jgi:hypothetical protein
MYLVILFPYSHYIYIPILFNGTLSDHIALNSLVTLNGELKECGKNRPRHNLSNVWLHFS